MHVKILKTFRSSNLQHARLAERLHLVVVSFCLFCFLYYIISSFLFSSIEEEGTKIKTHVQADLYCTNVKSILLEQ